MAYLGMLIFIVMFSGVIILAKKLTMPTANGPSIENIESIETVDIAKLWQQSTKNISQTAKVDNNVMQQAIALQALDLKGSFEKDEKIKQQIYSQYYQGCRLLILDLLPNDASHLKANSKNDAKGYSNSKVIKLAERLFKPMH